MKRLRLITLAFAFCLAAGLPLRAMAGPVPGGPDTDGDGVENAFDNCNGPLGLFNNPTQGDLDHDGCGDGCDFDINNNGTVSLAETNVCASQLGSTTPAGKACGPTGAPPCPGPPYNCCIADVNHNGTVTLAEVNACKSFFNKKPGVSGITNAQCKPTRCACTPAP